ncbi:hypothetical protein M8C21_007880, partial [Ambrosia artemisiifolia]
MLELYEQNRVAPSQTSEVVDGSTGQQEHHVTNDGNGSEETRERRETVESSKEKYLGRNLDYKGQSPQDAIKRLDKDKVKAALEKRRKARGGDVTRKTDLMDEDDLIERALEDGIELAAEPEKNRKHNWSKSVNDDGME